MSGIAEVGATGVELKEHQCSIKKITVSTKWKDPDLEVPKEVCTTVYDHAISEKGKTIFLISSPKGEDVIIKIEREEGECKRESHRKYEMSWDDYKKSDEGNATANDNKEKDISYTKTKSKVNIEGLALAAARDCALSYPLPILLPFNLIKTPVLVEHEIKNEGSFSIKCFEIGGVWEALKYLCLPIPLEKKYITKFTHLSCKEGSIHYQIISYPDISFEIEFSMGMKDKGKKTYYSFGELIDLDFKWCSPALKTKVTYNGKANKILLDVDFNRIEDIKSNWDVGKKNEEKKVRKTVDYENLKTKETKTDEKQLISIKYIENDVVKEEFSSKFFEELPLAVKKTIAFFRAIIKMCDHDFTKKIMEVFKTCMDHATEIQCWYLNIIPPKVKISVVGKYQTSEDLSRIGRVVKANITADPAIGISGTIDLLAIILNLASDGFYSALYLFLKNIKKIIEDLFEEEIQDVPGLYMDFVISGLVKIPVLQIIWDTSNEKEQFRTNLNTLITGEGKLGEIGEIKLDFKAGAKGSIDVLVVITAAVDVSISETSGVSFIIGLHVEDDGLHVPIDVLFKGLKWKYCMKARVGLKKIIKSILKHLGLTETDYELSNIEGESKQLKIGKLKLTPKLDKAIWLSKDFHLYNSKKSAENI